MTEAERDISEWVVIAPEQEMGGYGVSTVCLGDWGWGGERA